MNVENDPETDVDDRSLAEKFRDAVFNKVGDYLGVTGSELAFVANRPLTADNLIKVQKINKKITPNYHAFYIIVKKDRQSFLDHLFQNGIQAYVGYESLHNSKYSKSLNLNVSLKNTEKLAPFVVRLPLHTSLVKKDIAYVSNKINE